MPCHCYILFSTKLNKYYVGSTTDLQRRLEDHNQGKEKFTSTGTIAFDKDAKLLQDLKGAGQEKNSSPASHHHQKNRVQSINFWKHC